jgi:hypothetical protein
MYGFEGQNDCHTQYPVGNVVYEMSYSQIVFLGVNAEHRFPSVPATRHGGQDPSVLKPATISL